MSGPNFTARQRVAHKLAGAAYQMTFVEDYDRAMAIMASAIDFWEDTRDEPLSDEEAASIYDLSPGSVTVELPGRGEREDRGIVDDTAAEAGDDDPPDPLFGDESDGGGLATLSVPGEGTKARKATRAILDAHADGHEWVEPSDLVEYGLDKQNDRVQVPSLRHSKDFVQWRTITGQRAHQYRIDPDVRADLARELGVGE